MGWIIGLVFVGIFGVVIFAIATLADSELPVVRHLFRFILSWLMGCAGALVPAFFVAALAFERGSAEETFLNYILTIAVIGFFIGLYIYSQLRHLK